MHTLGDPDDGPPTSPAYLESSFDIGGSSANLSFANITSSATELAIYGEISLALNTTLLFCFYCNGDRFSPNADCGILANDIIADTGRAANALLSFITTVGLNLHNHFLNSLTTLQVANVVVTTVVRVPRGCSANGCSWFISVVTRLAVHLVYVSIITGLYARQIRYSRYANIWHAISQLVTGETKSVSEIANDISDGVVTETLSKENDGRFVKLERFESGRVEIVKHPLKLRESARWQWTNLKEKMTIKRPAKKRE